jgi:hypothetical protein
LKDDIVSVRPGLMRNVLHPTKQASYIDKYNGPRDRNTAVVQSEVQQVPIVQILARLSIQYKHMFIHAIILK